MTVFFLLLKISVFHPSEGYRNGRAGSNKLLFQMFGITDNLEYPPSRLRRHSLQRENCSRWERSKFSPCGEYPQGEGGLLFQTFVITNTPEYPPRLVTASQFTPPRVGNTSRFCKRSVAKSLGLRPAWHSLTFKLHFVRFHLLVVVTVYAQTRSVERTSIRWELNKSPHITGIC